MEWRAEDIYIPEIKETLAPRVRGILVIESFRSSAFVVLTFFLMIILKIVHWALDPHSHLRRWRIRNKINLELLEKARRGINLNTSSTAPHLRSLSVCAYKSKIDFTQFLHDRSSLIKIKHAKSSIGNLTVDGWRLLSERGFFLETFGALLKADSFGSLLATQFVIVLMRISQETLLIAINCWKALSSRAQLAESPSPTKTKWDAIQ